ncbi:hypothetical protein, partial [Alteromonas abrolhosensis]|uniref:hypothetical protein n=1 Tax=Alteromonas abrolhosensis TaxID=1892904 RepID=UPI003BAC499E
MASCTITNNDIAPTLTLTKLVINDEGGIAGANDFNISVGGIVVLSGETNNYAANTPLAINETLLADYIFVSITGDAKCPAALGGLVSLDEGENLVCTITNNDVIDPPAEIRLTLLKDVINDNGGNQLDTAWTLRASGPVVRSGIEGSAAVTNSVVLPGIYTLSESGPGGYIASGWSCAGGSLSGNQLTLVAGDAVS